MQAIHPSSPRVPTMASPATQYWVFSADNNHVGPVSAELIARGIAAGKVPEDAFVAPAGSTAWVPLATVPEIAEAMKTAGSHPSSMRPSAMNIPTMQPAVPPPAPLPADVPIPIASPLAPPLGGAQAEAAPAPPVEAKKEEKKDEPKKPVLDPKFKFLPLAIFGVCAFIGIIETAIVLIARG